MSSFVRSRSLVRSNPASWESSSDLSAGSALSRRYFAAATDSAWDTGCAGAISSPVWGSRRGYTPHSATEVMVRSRATVGIIFRSSRAVRVRCWDSRWAGRNTRYLQPVSMSTGGLIAMLWIYGVVKGDIQIPNFWGAYQRGVHLRIRTHPTARPNNFDPHTPSTSPLIRDHSYTITTTRLSGEDRRCPDNRVVRRAGRLDCGIRSGACAAYGVSADSRGHSAPHFPIYSIVRTAKISFLGLSPVSRLSHRRIYLS